MKAFARLSPTLVTLALLTAPSVWGQILTGKGFTADPNGYRSDEPLASPQQKAAPGTTIKDCSECPEMVVLPSGSFLIGSPPDPGPDPFSNEMPKALESPEEKPQHRVQIQSFAIGKYEVTQEQWYAVMSNNPSQYKGRTLPVEQVSWDDVQQFIEKLNQKTGQKYRLPSEAEWEYAARAGTTTEWSHGNDESKLGNYAWYSQNSGSKTQAVGQKLSNAFGLYDMHGNVWEWTQDCWHNNYFDAPTDGSAWTTGCSGHVRVLRGGSWGNSPAGLRSAFRGRSGLGNRNYINGFRLARTLFTP
jgi:formylglycine-generating enzyme required for sulfatase activity